MNELRSRSLFTIRMTLLPTLELGATPAGTRRVFTVASGTFAGDRLRGEVLAQGGSDLLLGVNRRILSTRRASPAAHRR
jgi:hypothetical protein